MKKFAFLFFVILGLCSTSCNNDVFGCLRPDGQVEEREIILGGDITKIDLEIEADLVVVEGAEQKILVESTDNIIDAITSDSKLEGDKWVIKIDECSRLDNVLITVTIPELESLDLSGIGRISTDGVFSNIDDLSLEIDGTGDIEVLLDEADVVDMEINGTGTISVNGVCEVQIIDINGTGDINNFGLTSETARVEIDGSANVDLTVTELLDVEFSGTGRVCYKGNPSITQDVSGTGSITDCN